MTIKNDLATLRSTLVEDGWLEHPDSPLAALDRVDAEIARLEREVGQQDVLIQRWMTEAEDKQAEIARLQQALDEAYAAHDKTGEQAEAAEAEVARLEQKYAKAVVHWRDQETRRRAAENEVERLRQELEARDDAELIGHAQDARDAAEQRYGQGFFPGPTPMERQMADDGAADADSTGDLDADLQAQGFDPFGSGGAA